MKLEHILTRLVDGARQALQADAAAVRLLVGPDVEPAKDVEDGRGPFLSTEAASGLSAAFFERGAVAVDLCPLDGEALSGQPVIIADTSQAVCAQPEICVSTSDDAELLLLPSLVIYSLRQARLFSWVALTSLLSRSGMVL